MMRAGPQLRDIVMPSEPSMWPLAPGWWVLLAVLLSGFIAGAIWAVRRWRRHRRRVLLQRLFDVQLAHASSAAQRLQLASACLRRAVRASEPGQASVTGTAWLELLDGDDPARPFSTGPGRPLLDGPFQAAVDAAAVEPAVALARARFLQLATRSHD